MSTKNHFLLTLPSLISQPGSKEVGQSVRKKEYRFNTTTLNLHIKQTQLHCTIASTRNWREGGREARRKGERREHQVRGSGLQKMEAVLPPAAMALLR